MASEPDPQVNDDDVEEGGSASGGDQLSQLLGDYAEYLRDVVAKMDDAWVTGLRPRLNKLIHAMEKEVEVP